MTNEVLDLNNVRAYPARDFDTGFDTLRCSTQVATQFSARSGQS